MPIAVPRILPDVQAAISNYTQELDAVVKELSTEQEKQFTVPPILYHYTDGTGLLGILDSGTIRLTDVFGLNDPSEIRHGIEHASKLFTKLTTGRPVVEPFSAQFSETMKGHIEQIARIFVASFSRSGNDLGQWRAYAANGTGFALGFDGPLLEKAFVAQGSDRNTTIHLYYDDKHLTQAMERLVRPAMQILEWAANRKLPETLVRTFLSSIADPLGIASLHVAMLFKHPAYRNEDEYRFMHIRPTDAKADAFKYRARGSSLIRYAEFDWRKHCPDALREVAIGPAVDATKAASFISECLTIAGINPDPIRIWQSEIPYRG
jgi:hypothetical protein